MTALRYLAGYPTALQDQVRELLASGGLGAWLLRRHPSPHGLRTDGALYRHVETLRQTHMRQTPRLSRVAYDSKIQVVRHALGVHVSSTRVQGGRLKAQQEIRVASVFRDAPLAFLNMIAVHELAHLKESEHNKAFYRLCEHMEPAYHQLEMELRLYLVHLEAGGERLWATGEGVAP